MNADSNDSLIKSLERDSSAFLFGEIHGTVEMPSLVGNLIKCFLRKSLRVCLHLEIPRDSESFFGQFINGGAVRDCHVSEFWTEVDDGRASKALFDLMSQLKSLYDQFGDSLGLFCFDVSWGVSVLERERSMAEYFLKSAEVAQDALHIIYAGNFHAQTRVAASFPTPIVPMGVHIVEAGFPLTSVFLSHTGGSACFSDGERAQSRQVLPSAMEAQSPGQLVRLGLDYPWDWEYNVGPVNASLAFCS